MDDLIVSNSEIVDAVPADASVQHLCSMLVQCEQSQRRLQWTSGVILLTLMNNPEAPKKMGAFVDWLAERTGMRLTQNEITRRVTVYRFYSKFDDQRIVELIQSGGVHIAYRAQKVLAHDDPEQVHTVLQACVADPGKVNETLEKLAGAKAHKRNRRISKTKFTDFRRRITEVATDGKVTIETVFALLEELETD